jgi:hypothetical protein
MRLEGGCYCGAVRYVAEGEPVLKAQCHCRACQHIPGGAPNLFMLMPAEGFSYTRPDKADAVTQEFCAVCGTHMITRRPGLSFPSAVKNSSIGNDNQSKDSSVPPTRLPQTALALHCGDEWVRIISGNEAFDHQGTESEHQHYSNKSSHNIGPALRKKSSSNGFNRTASPNALPNNGFSNKSPLCTLPLPPWLTQV